MARRMSRFIHFAMAAGKEAVADSGIDFNAMTPEQRDRVGVVVNTGGGGIEQIIDGTHVHDQKGPRFVSPFAIPVRMSRSRAVSRLNGGGSAAGPRCSVVSMVGPMDGPRTMLPAATARSASMIVSGSVVFNR